MTNVNNQFVLSLGIVVLGYVGKKFGLVHQEDGEGLSRIILNLILPAVIINTFNHMRIDASMSLLPLIGLTYGLLMALLAIVIFRKRTDKSRGIMSMVLPGFNIGLFAFPLIANIWGSEGIKYFAMFDVGNAFILLGVCYTVGYRFSGEKGSVGFRSLVINTFRSVPLIVYAVTLTLNLSGLQYPSFMMDIAGIISKANLPMSMLLLGIWLDFSLVRSHWKDMAKVLSIRYFFGLFIGIILFLVMPVGIYFRYTVLIVLILPVGLSTIPFAVKFGYDKKFAGTLANISNIISFALMWLILALASY